MQAARGQTAVRRGFAALVWLLVVICANFAIAELEDLPRSMPVAEALPPATPGTVVSPAPPPTATIINSQPMPGVMPYSMSEAIAYDAPWSWQIMPQGLIWHSYLAGVREPRMASLFNYQSGLGWLWDATVGGRVGLLRYGSLDTFRPQGWQLDVEGAAFPELLMDQNWDLHSVDFRVGVPLTYGVGNWQFKFEPYHLSSHLGDEFMISHPTTQRINYSRNALVFGASVYATENTRLYGEVGWAFYNDGGSEPWEFQFGAEYSPIFRPGFAGTPFAAVNAHLRQEVNFGGALTVQVGWQWFNGMSGTRIRVGFQYMNGKNEQYQFFNEFVQQFGIGIWYDF